VAKIRLFIDIDSDITTRRFLEDLLLSLFDRNPCQSEFSRTNSPLLQAHSPQT
jgi:hypothetical protein